LFILQIKTILQLHVPRMIGHRKLQFKCDKLGKT
jgi:hypothetical protein